MSFNISQFGGGGGSFIGDLRPISTNKRKFVASDQTWIRSGQLDDDVASYPDAEIKLGEITGYASGFDYSTEFTNVGGTGYDESTSLFYLYDSTSRKAYIYNDSGTNTGSTPALNSGPNGSVNGFTVKNGYIYVAQGTSIYKYTDAGVYDSTLPETFPSSVSSNSTIYFDEEENTFLATTTSGLGGAVGVMYVNQSNSEKGNLGQTAAISGYTSYGLTVVFGQVLVITYSSSADQGRIYRAQYNGPTTNSITLAQDLVVASSTFDATYGLASNQAGIYSASRTTGETVNVTSIIGVGEVNETSINDNGKIFYYARVK